jgi:DNA primase
LMPTAALMGTHITPAAIDLLKKHKYKLVLIALDNDASTKSIEMAAQLKLDFPYVAPVMLKKDIKNMTYQEIESLWKNYFYPHLQKVGVLTKDSPEQ